MEIVNCPMFSQTLCIDVNLFHLYSSETTRTRQSIDGISLPISSSNCLVKLSPYCLPKKKAKINLQHIALFKEQLKVLNY